MKKSYIVALIVIVIIAISLYYLLPARVVEKVIVGATPTLDGIDLPFVKINGVETAYVSDGIKATSTMLCAIKNPYNGTSTIDRITVRITDGILGANAFSISTTSNSIGYGSSTPAIVLNRNVPSNSEDGVAWFPHAATTTSGLLPGFNSLTGESNYFVRNGEYVVVRLATTTTAGALADYYNGQCSVMFTRI